jgi:hypothetical protein
MTPFARLLQQSIAQIRKEQQMPLIIKGTNDFVPAPEGLHPAACVDVIDRGQQQTPWGEKHQIALVWELAILMDDGRPFTVRKSYTASLHEKSNLHRDLKAWRGRAFTPQEMAGFDIENVLHKPCQLLVQHAEKDGIIYANVAAVMRAGPGQRLAPSGHYVRVKDRQIVNNGHNGPNRLAVRPEEDEIPF